MIGLSTAGQGRARHGAAGQGAAGQGLAWRGRARHGRAGPGGAGQGKARQGDQIMIQKIYLFTLAFVAWVLFVLFSLWTNANATEISTPDMPICSGITGLQPYPKAGTVVTTQAFELQPGHWDCNVAAESVAKGNATTQALQVSLSATANSLSAFPWTATSGAAGGPNFGMSITGSHLRIDSTAPKTYFVNALVYFLGGTMSVKTYYQCVKAQQ